MTWLVLAAGVWLGLLLLGVRVEQILRVEWTPWWGTLLDGLISSIVGGIVAAVTAVVVVRMTSSRQRQDDLLREARGYLLTLLLSAEGLLESLRYEPFDPELTVTSVHLRVWPSLVQARVAIELLDRGDASKDLLNLSSGVVAAARARIKGEPPAVLLQRVGLLRVCIKALLRDLTA